MSEFLVPEIQRKKIEEFLEKEGKRLDNRGPGDYRKIEVRTGISKNAESSVSVKLGNTEVFAGVKLAITEPYPDSPDEGVLMTNAELPPIASDEFELGRPGINAIELGRVIDRGIRESGFIDFKKLCIKEGEKVWIVFVDIIALNDDGNLFDAAGLAAIIALGRARFPVYNEQEDKLEHELTDTPLPLNKESLSFNMTFHKIGKEIVLDVTKEEEAISKYRISFAVGEHNGEPRITAVQKGKEGTISDDDMEKILNLLEVKWKELFPKIKEYVFG